MSDVSDIQQQAAPARDLANLSPPEQVAGDDISAHIAHWLGTLALT
jgi:hypothetical protein